MMLINDIGISNYKARLTSKNIGPAAVTVYDDWLKNAISPIYFNKQEAYKQIKLSFYIKDVDDNAAIMDISNLIAQLEKCTIKFNNIDFYYDCLIADTPDPQKLAVGKYTFDITLKASYAYLPEVTQVFNFDFNSSSGISQALTVYAKGNLPSPANLIIQVVDSTYGSIAPLKVGLEDAPVLDKYIENGFVLYSLTKGDNVFANGEKYTVTKTLGLVNIFNQFQGNFITLQPGKNDIPVGLEGIQATEEVKLKITIKYKPKFM